MNLLDYLGEWFLSNLNRLLFSAVALIVVYMSYRIVVKQIRVLNAKKKLEEHLAYTLIRITKWTSVVVAFSAVLGQWGVTLGTVAGLLAIYGGTIVGFAAINTLGNAISGLIVMTSRPFEVGDRILFNGQLADVVSVELIYTKMLTLDNVLVSVPNQELLKAEIDNYGKKKLIRRHVTVTPDFEYEAADIEKTLLEAAGKVRGVLKKPKPYVWITKFQNYAVEYNLYAYIEDVKRLPEIDAELHRAVLETCKKNNVDISTPLLLKQLRE